MFLWPYLHCLEAFLFKENKEVKFFFGPIEIIWMAVLWKWNTQADVICSVPILSSVEFRRDSRTCYQGLPQVRDWDITICR